MSLEPAQDYLQAAKEYPLILIPVRSNKSLGWVGIKAEQHFKTVSQVSTVYFTTTSRTSFPVRDCAGPEPITRLIHGLSSRIVTNLSAATLATCLEARPL